MLAESNPVKYTNIRLRSILVPLALLFLWDLMVRFEFLPPSQSASPLDVAVRLFNLVAHGSLTDHWMYSVSRLLAGVLIGTGLGTITGVVLANAQRSDVIISPTLQFLASVPVVVWMPFWIIVFGTGELFKIGLTATAGYFLAHVYAYAAAKSVARRYFEVAMIYEKSLLQKLLGIVLPSVTPAMITGARISMALGWVVIFFAESAASLQGAEGLGWFVANARQVGRVEDEFAGFLAIGITGFIFDQILALAQRWSNTWNQTVDTMP
jgi:sulfonate transport system permease protein